MISKNQKQSLIDRVNRFLNHYARPIPRIPVHRNDLLSALHLRRSGEIPNLPINVLGGNLFPHIITYNQGEK